jgi:IS1 family transposase
MNCKKCGDTSVRNGKVKSTGTQRYYCKRCNRSFIEIYTRKSFEYDLDERLVALLKESCGIRSISRILGISPKTVIAKIKRIADKLERPMILKGCSYEMDEMFTYIGNKDQRVCIAYAIDRNTRDVVGYSVGRRNLKTLRIVTETLVLSDAKEIGTDRLNLYRTLIPKEIHHVKRRGINYIERKNLTLRTHIKRLNRRTIAYSKSLIVLSAILKIYFWS